MSGRPLVNVSVQGIRCILSLSNSYSMGASPENEGGLRHHKFLGSGYCAVTII